METRVIISFTKLALSILISFFIGTLSGTIIGIFIGSKIKKFK